MAENNKFQCTGNCLNCLPAQRAYCASQHSYSNMKVLDAMMAEVLTMKESIASLSEKIDAIQNNEAEIFDPTEEKTEIPTLPSSTSEKPTDHAIAQGGDGAEE